MYASYFQGRRKQKVYVKYVFWKVFKKSKKLLKSPLLVMLQNFFNSKSTHSEMGHSTGNRRALKHSGTRRARGHTRHLSTWGTQALEAHLDTLALRYSGTRGTWGILFSRLAIFTGQMEIYLGSVPLQCLKFVKNFPVNLDKSCLGL